MKEHTTIYGDRFLLNHITDTTKWSARNRPRNTAARLFTYGGSAALVIIIFLFILSAH